MSTDSYQKKYRVASARLADYDYGSNGLYFITICTRDRACFFGDIDPEMAVLVPSLIGQYAIDCWQAIPSFAPYIDMDAFQLMPNHLHGILCINKPEQTDWQPSQFGPQRQNLASVIRGFKAGITRFAIQQELEFGWQPRFYDRVIRNDSELKRIRTYIKENPAKWAAEKDNLMNLYM